VGVIRDHGRAPFWDLGAMRSPENASRSSILWANPVSVLS
jgi:hypothetical protein